jgi:tetratricopeptide (TPR) repeat protein
MSKLKTSPFSKLIKTESELITIRKEYSHKTAKQRRKAAQWQYDTEVAQDMFSSSLPDLTGFLNRKNNFDAGVISLAIDPLYAPALLTVGSLEYQYERIDEAMALFLKLTELSPEEPDLPEIIDKAGDFLTDNKDYNNALAIYISAEKAFPKTALYYVGSGYCLSKLKKYDLAIEKYQTALSIEPDNCKHLNDLGYTFFEAGNIENAIKFLEEAQAISPPDYDLPKSNLEYIRSQLKKQHGQQIKTTIASKKKIKTGAKRRARQ